MNIDLYKQTGEKAGELSLPKEIFEVEFNGDLIHQALVMQLANQRTPLAHTKTRAEVSGGGRKPYKQKGTGNARQGSIRSPHYKGGGRVFGPRNVKNFSKMMPKAQRRQALFSALSEKVRSKEVIGLEGYEMTKPKTKEFAAMIAKLPVQRKVLVIIPGKSSVVQKSAENLPNIKIIQANYTNIQDLQRFKSVVLFKDAVDVMKKTFLSSTK